MCHDLDMLDGVEYIGHASTSFCFEKNHAWKSSKLTIFMECWFDHKSEFLKHKFSNLDVMLSSTNFYALSNMRIEMLNVENKVGEPPKINKICALMLLFGLWFHGFL